jgi:glycosyltransferase involved in cell wall biosynthesis
MAPPLPFASIAIPTRNEERTIRECLEGVLGQDYPPGRYEVLVLDGDSSDRTRAIVAEIASRSPVPVRLLDNPKHSTPAALNVALREARGEYLVRVDAHSVPEPTYVRRCIEANLELGADLAGGWREAVGTGPVSRAVAAALSSPFSMGNPTSWNRPSTPREIASVPCGSYRLAALRAIGGFDEGQLANQDYEANYRLRRAGGKLVLLPDLSVRYFPRDSFGGLARQFARYGFYKARTMVKHPSSVRLRHLVPSPGLAAALALVVLSPFSASARWILLLALGGYLVALFAASAVAYKRLGAVALLLPAVFATMHASWALGNTAGLLCFWPRRRALRAG